MLVKGGGQRLTARVDPLTNASVGQPIKLALDMTKTYFFDKKTGEEIR